MPAQPRPPRAPQPGEDEEDDSLLQPYNRGLGMRGLALLGALSFVMLGISSLVPLLQPPPKPQLPDQRQPPVG